VAFFLDNAQDTPFCRRDGSVVHGIWSVPSRLDDDGNALYHLINDNTDLILDRVDGAKDVAPYVWLLNRLHECDVREDGTFQSEYRKYWRMNAARLGEGFYRRYFELLEECKRSGPVGLERVLRELYAVPSDARGSHKVHLAFATKLLHMVSSELPIYDAMIDDFYFLPELRGRKSLDRRIKHCIRILGFLGLEYYRVLDEERLLADAVRRFRGRFRVPASYTDVKVLDTLIWRFVTLLRAGAVVDGDVVYTG